MTYIISAPETLHSNKVYERKQSPILAFFKWAADQEKNHIGWVGISVVLIAAAFFPLTLMAILLNGAIFSLIVTTMISLVMVVVVNLAALPTRYTIPILFFGIFIDLVALVLSFVIH